MLIIIVPLSRRGLIRREDTSSIIQSTQPITIEKHELHSTWPIYSVPDDHELGANEVFARVYRKQTCYGPGDKVEVRVILTSKNVSPVKIKSVALSIRETVTFKGNKRGSRLLGGPSKAANQKTESIAQKAQSLGTKLYRGDTKTYDMSVTIPKSHALMTIQTAKHIEVAYEMRVYVDTKHPIVLDHLPLTITNVPRATSATIVPLIGFVPGLSAPLDSADHGSGISRPASAGARPKYGIGRSSSGDSSSPVRAPTRSYSFLSNSPSKSSSDRHGGGYGNNSNLNRRDTMMTTASGPGLAGRGIPGQLFGWNQQNGGAAPFGLANQAPRPAFAGPASIYEGRELAPEENRALFHHSYASPLGQVFEGQELIPGTVAHQELHHQQQHPEYAVPISLQQQQEMENERRLTSTASPSRQMKDSGRAQDKTLSPQEAAEAEKERLYQRAREQAERNQRRAAKAAAAAAASGPNGGGTASGRTASASLAAEAAVNEKQRLYQRARREAERYQAGFDQGASFPQEDLSAREEVTPSSSVGHESKSRHSNGNAVALAAANGALNAPAKTTAPSSTGPIRPIPTRPAVSAYPSAEEEKQRLYEAAKAERDAHLASTNSETTTGGDPASSSSQAQTTFPSAEEEKRRFAAAQAERDAFLRGQPSAAGGSSLQSQATVRPEVNSTAKPQASMPGAFPSAEDEKRALYERAKAEVDATQSQQHQREHRPAPNAYPSAEEEKRRLYEQAQAEVAAHQQGSSRIVSDPPAAQASATLPLNGADEKAQLKRYWEAQDAVARFHEQEGSSRPRDSNHSNTVRQGPEIPPKVPAGATGPDTSNGSIPFLPGAFPAATHDQDADDSASVFSLPVRSASVVAGKQRHAPSPPASPPPPTLPTFSFSSLSGALPGGVDGSKGPQGGVNKANGMQYPQSNSNRSSLYAPKMAPINWHEEEEEGETGRESSDGYSRSGHAALTPNLSTKAPGPPLPPKTPLSGRPY